MVNLNVTQYYFVIFSENLRALRGQYTEEQLARISCMVGTMARDIDAGH
jgi:hypothetical protein